LIKIYTYGDELVKEFPTRDGKRKRLRSCLWYTPVLQSVRPVVIGQEYWSLTRILTMLYLSLSISAQEDAFAVSSHH